MNLYSLRRGEYAGEILPQEQGHKFSQRVSALRIVPMPNGRFGLVRAAFRGSHWVERPVGDREGYASEMEAERAGRGIT